MDLSNVDLDLLEQLLSEEGIDAGRGDHAVRPRAPGTRVPLSFSQELLWLLDQASPGLTAYNLSAAYRLVGALDVGALQRSLAAIVERHEVLRTRFSGVGGEPEQVVDASGAFALTVLDLGDRPGTDRDAEITRELHTRTRTPFDLGKEHLFRATLVRIEPANHVLLLETHHAVCDGWSLGIIMKELGKLYQSDRRGTSAGLPPLPFQFGDYAIWQRDTLRGQRLDDLLSFWRTQLGDATEPLGLPTDFPPPVPPTFAGSRIGTTLSPDLFARVKAFGRTQDATLYMTLLAAYATVLHRYTGRANVLVGSGVAGRGEHATESLVGYFNNTLIQRVDFTDDPTFAELLARVRHSALGAYDHQEVPLEKLVLELREGQERVSAAPLFQVVFTMQDQGSMSLGLEGLDVQPFGVELGATKFDITLLPMERDGGLRLTVAYRSDLFAPATMSRFLGHLRQVLETVVVDATCRISELPLLTPEELAALADANDTDVDEGPAATLVDLFERAAQAPARVAVIDGSVSLTYGELNTRANQLAHRLRDIGVTANSPVGLALDRSADAIVGLLGILKAGGCYVPLSPDLPPTRLLELLSESSAMAIVSASSYAPPLPPSVTRIDLETHGIELAALPALNPAHVATPDSLAYVLFTSGSTGTPKGVAVTHANIVHYARAVSRVLGDVPRAQPGDALTGLKDMHFGIVSTFSADLGNTSLFPALLSGGTLHVLPPTVTTEPQRYATYLAEHPLDVLKVTPGHLRALIAGATGAELGKLLPRLWLVLGGEAFGTELARTLLGAGTCRIMNHYGPTETTVGVLTFEVTSQSLSAAINQGTRTVPLGRPLANTQTFVVNETGHAQPIGVPGELFIGGAGVTQGYVGKPALTKERFETFEGARIYRSGDRVRRLADGTIEFLGRIDDQVKVRGYRVELGEIKAAMRTHPGVADAEVVLQVEAGDSRLVAYALARQAGYATSHTDHATTESIREWIVLRLPEYMIPGTIVMLDAMPLTANGKVDKARLPALSVTEIEHMEPRTDLEQRLASIWAEVLKRENVGVTDDFLLLGGHSLLAIRILGKISKAFGVRLSLRSLFDAPTVAQLAEVLDVELQLAALDTLTDDGSF